MGSLLKADRQSSGDILRGAAISADAPTSLYENLLDDNYLAQIGAGGFLQLGPHEFPISRSQASFLLRHRAADPEKIVVVPATASWDSHDDRDGAATMTIALSAEAILAVQAGEGRLYRSALPLDDRRISITIRRE